MGSWQAVLITDTERVKPVPRADVYRLDHTKVLALKDPVAGEGLFARIEVTIHCPFKAPFAFDPAMGNIGPAAFDLQRKSIADSLAVPAFRFIVSTDQGPDAPSNPVVAFEVLTENRFAYIRDDRKRKTPTLRLQTRSRPKSAAGARPPAGRVNYDRPLRGPDGQGDSKAGPKFALCSCGLGLDARLRT